MLEIISNKTIYFLQVILIFSILNNEYMLGEEYKYPDWAFPLGWVLTGSSVMCIPLYMIYKFDRTRGNFKRVSSTELNEILNFNSSILFYREYEQCLSQNHSCQMLFPAKLAQ